MLIKNILLTGIYINNEYPLHVKRIRDTLRLILRLTKNNPQYKEKSKLEGDHLVINGTNFGICNLNKLPSDLAPYKAAQKEDSSDIAFHGELNPYSNFHRSNFMLNDHQFHSQNNGSSIKRHYYLVIVLQQIRYWQPQLLMSLSD